MEPESSLPYLQVPVTLRLIRGLYRGIKRQENDAGASPASSEQFKNMALD